MPYTKKQRAIVIELNRKLSIEYKILSARWRRLSREFRAILENHHPPVLFETFYAINKSSIEKDLGNYSIDEGTTPSIQFSPHVREISSFGD